MESSVQHTEQNSILIFSPQNVRDIVTSIERKIDRREVGTVILTTSGARTFCARCWSRPHRCFPFRTMKCRRASKSFNGNDLRPR